MTDYIYQMEPGFDEDDARQVAECVRSIWVIKAQRTADLAWPSTSGRATPSLALSLMALETSVAGRGRLAPFFFGAALALAALA